jgi:hypothetical protein
VVDESRGVESVCHHSFTSSTQSPTGQAVGQARKPAPTTRDSKVRHQRRSESRGSRWNSAGMPLKGGCHTPRCSWASRWAIESVDSSAAARIHYVRVERRLGQVLFPTRIEKHSHMATCRSLHLGDMFLVSANLVGGNSRLGDGWDGLTPQRRRCTRPLHTHAQRCAPIGTFD